MAIIKAVSSHAPIRVAIEYITKEEKTEAKLLSGIGVSPETACEEMEATKSLFNKVGGRTYKHFVQSFAPEEVITPEEAHAIAQEFAANCPKFKGFEVLVATHQDREHIHTHFILNSVSYADGHKFQMSVGDLKSMKDYSDYLCAERGLSVCEKGKSFSGQAKEGVTAWTKEQYQYLKKNPEQRSRKEIIAETEASVAECRDQAGSRDEFIELMKEKGYQVEWSDKRKHITFINADGKKVRDSALQGEISKEALEGMFKRNCSNTENISIVGNMRR